MPNRLTFYCFFVCIIHQTPKLSELAKINCNRKRDQFLNLNVLPSHSSTSGSVWMKAKTTFLWVPSYIAKMKLIEKSNKPMFKEKKTCFDSIPAYGQLFTDFLTYSPAKYSAWRLFHLDHCQSSHISVNSIWQRRLNIGPRECIYLTSPWIDEQFNWCHLDTSPINRESRLPT